MSRGMGDEAWVVRIVAGKETAVWVLREPGRLGRGPVRVGGEGQRPGLISEEEWPHWSWSVGVVV